MSEKPCLLHDPFAQKAGILSVAKFFTQFYGNSILPVHLQAGFCKDQICTGSPIINLRQ
jgi:hypothetical protein